MATELSMNGKKKIETIQKEFSSKFPYLTLIFLDKERQVLDGLKTLAEVRQSKGDDVSIVASTKINTLESKFLKNYGLVVEVSYKKDSEVLMTDASEQRTLKELNSWCEANGCSKFDYKKNKFQESSNIISRNTTHSIEYLFDEKFIGKAIAEHNAHEDEIGNEFEEVIIGSQKWLQKNLDVDKFNNGDPILYANSQEEWINAFEKRQPAYCNYCNNPNFGKKYGKLYNWYAINDPRGIAPVGWHVPTEEEFKILFDFIEEDDEVCDYKLKCEEGWGGDSDATNETGFTALPGGYRNDLTGFIGIFDDDNPEESYTGWWSSSENKLDSNLAYFRAIEYEYDGEQSWEISKGNGFSVRCIKNDLFTENKIKKSKEIVIGGQNWAVSNLDVSFFSNGDSIYEAKSSAEWIKANNEKKPAFCYYNFDQKNNHNYSKYYNFYALIDKRGLAPVSWEIPTLEDYKSLFTTIDSKAKFEIGEDFSTWEGVIAPSLKSTEIWEYEEPANNDPDGTGTNSSGFNLLGLGFIDNSGTFQLFMEQSYLWVRNKKDDNDFKSIIFDMSYTGILIGEKNNVNLGCQIRCLKKR